MGPAKFIGVCLSLTSIESKESFISDDFEEAVKAVSVHDLPNRAASLVLHPRLNQVNGVDGCSTRCCGEGEERGGEERGGEGRGGNERRKECKICFAVDDQQGSNSLSLICLFGAMIIKEIR